MTAWHSLRWSVLAGTFQVLLSRLQEGTLPGVCPFGGCPAGQCQGSSGCGHLSKKEGRSGQLQIQRMPRPSRPNPALGSLGAAPGACAKPRPNAPPRGHPDQPGGVNSQGVGGEKRASPGTSARPRGRQKSTRRAGADFGAMRIDSSRARPAQLREHKASGDTPRASTPTGARTPGEGVASRLHNNLRPGR